MSFEPTSANFNGTPIQTASTLAGPTLEALLAEFRAWAQESQQLVATPSVESPAGRDELGLHTLLGQFLALKQEVNLLTKAARAQQEQTGSTLTQLQNTFGELTQAKENLEDQLDDRVAEAERAAEKPLLKALVDVSDALGLAQREVARVQANLAEPVPEFNPPSEPTIPQAGPDVLATWKAFSPKVSFFQRWFGSNGADFLAQTQGLLEQQANENQALRQSLAEFQSQLATVRADELARLAQAEHLRKVLASVLTGYTMSMQRLERTLAAVGLEPIETVGQNFDPEIMEALEAVHNSGRPANEVVDEVKRGYRWEGKLFRYAQVRVAARSM